MQARMPDVYKLAAGGHRALAAMESFLNGSDAPQETLELVRLRVSQINGCGLCVDMHAHQGHQKGITQERLWAVAAWREAPFFTDAERAALALAESVTRIADNPDGVEEEVWREAAAHFDEPALAALVMAIASVNAWNRINVATRQIAGSYR
ncbi:MULTISPECIES: carboxymuconolactone decarboxylase family protein [unclassified Nonomuraea]|uniref:carboxymuconolactone decarboxylase family protein n=1 Tax=unclassified Nonomuraea TaxID=2593643 RepID=UPI0033FE159C